MVERPVWPSRGWWAALAAVLTLAGVLRFTGYNFGLPYIDNPDEPAFCLHAAMQNDGTLLGRYMDRYAPTYIIMYRLLDLALNDRSQFPVSHIAIMRFVSALASVIGVAALGLLAFQVAGPEAGLLAAALWAVLPDVVAQGIMALPEVHGALSVVLAVLCTALALRTMKQRWVLMSFVFALLAFSFKYMYAPVLFVVAVGLLAQRSFLKSVRSRRTVVVGLVVTSVVVAVILFFYGGFQLLESYTRWGRWEGEGLQRVPVRLPLTFFTDNLRIAGSDQYVIGLLAAGGWILMLVQREGRRRLHIGALGVTLGAATLFLIVLSLFGVQPYRRLFTLAAVLAVLCGVGLSAYVHLIAEALSRLFCARRAQPAGLLKALRIIPGVALTVTLLAPLTATSWAEAQKRALRDTRVDLMIWADMTLKRGPYLAGSVEFHKVFNPFWGGYHGDVNDFPLYRTAPIVAEPIEAWREAGVQYAVLDQFPYRQLYEVPEVGRPYLDGTLLLKTFPSSPDRRGPDAVVLYMKPIQHPLSVNFGDEIELIGYDLSAERVRPGESITITHYWQALRTPSANYTVFNHLVPPDSLEVVAQADGLPLSERRLPSTWTDPDEVLIGRAFEITIDGDTPPGVYRLLTGLYVREDGRRLPVVGGDEDTDYAVLALLTVTR